MRFITFERTAGHCQIDLLTGETLTHALGNYLHCHWNAPIDERGWVESADGFEHPLQFIEREIKADATEDELAVDMDSCITVNEHSFEVRVLAEGALRVSCASVFTSAEPSNVSGEIVNGRMDFVRTHADFDARAFFWYVRDGLLVSFFNLTVTEEGRAFEILARYLIRNDDPWTAVPWVGSYEDLAEQMTN